MRKLVAFCVACLGLSAAEPTVVDLTTATGQVPIRASEPGVWSLEGTVHYDRTTQTLRVQATYRSEQDLEPGTTLSYRVFGAGGEVLQQDGQRFAADAEGRPFTVDFVPEVVERRPDEEQLVLALGPVWDGHYWYWDKYPEINYPRLELRGLPPRDHYVPVMSWLPRYLPHDLRLRLPTWWRVEQRDAVHSGFVPSLDLRHPETKERVRSARVGAGPMVEQGRFRGTFSLWGDGAGSLEMRPGLVWDDVRWYEAEDWFAYRTVHFVSPLWYLAGLVMTGLVLVVLGTRDWRRWHGWAAWPVRVALILVGLWWLLHTLVSGYGPAMFVLGLGALMVRFERLSWPTRIYGLAWLFMVYVDWFWARRFGPLDHVVNVQGSALVFAAAVWALLLLPLLAVRRLKWLVPLAALLTAGWWLATTVGVVYHSFFRDFPSVGDLFYAGQIGELGDSVGFLTVPGHWVPLVLWGLMIAVASAATWTQRKIQAEKM